MVGLAAELRETNIHVNAISPVAARRGLRRSTGGLAPELVAPGVGVPRLVSMYRERCGLGCRWRPPLRRMVEPW